MVKRKPGQKPRKTPRPEHLLEASRLQQRFKDDGDMLAPFHCCAYWRQEGLPTETLPVWVQDHLFSLAADYYETGPRYRNGEPVVPRCLLEMPRKRREAVLPSLDKAARLLGGRGKPGAWLWRAEHDRDAYVRAYLDGFVKRRDAGIPQFVQLQSGKMVPVFVEQGRNKGLFRSVVLDDIASRFRIKGQNDKSRETTMRRRFLLN